MMKVKCQNCQFEFEQNENQDIKFCPNCGGKMETPEGSRLQIEEKKTNPVIDFGIYWIKRIFSFKGRARRLEFWTISLSLWFLFVIVPLLIIIKTDSFDSVDPYIFVFILLILRTPVAIRRLHDIGKSGWWLILLILVSLIPYIGQAICFCFFVKDSEPGDNIYGPNPKGISAGN